MDEVTKIDISDELRQTAGYLINGTIADGEVSTFMLTDAADEIDSLRSRLAAQSAAPVGTGCICQDQHRRGYCTEPGCSFAVAPVGELETQLREAMDLLQEARLSSIHHATEKAALRNELEALLAAKPSSGPPVGWGDDYPEDQS